MSSSAPNEGRLGLTEVGRPDDAWQDLSLAELRRFRRRLAEE